MKGQLPVDVCFGDVSGAWVGQLKACARVFAYSSCVAMLVACGGGESDEAAQKGSAVSFDSPKNQIAIAKAFATASARLNVNSDELSLDEQLWGELDIWRERDSSPVNTTTQCNYAYSPSSDEGEYGLVQKVNQLGSNPSYLQETYTNCEGYYDTRDGSIRITINKWGGASYNEPADSFTVSYDNFHIKRNGVEYFIDGEFSVERYDIAEHVQFPSFLLTASFTTRSSNENVDSGISNLSARCEFLQDDNYDEGHRCFIEEGELLVPSVGGLPLQSLHGFRNSVWSKFARTTVTNSGGEELILWGSHLKRFVTTRLEGDLERRYELVSDALVEVVDTLAEPSLEPGLRIFLEENKGWDNSAYLWGVDELLLLDKDDSNVVVRQKLDPIERSEILFSSPVNDLVSNGGGDELITGHDNFVLHTYFQGQDGLQVNRADYGLGDIVEVFPGSLVGYRASGTQYTQYSHLSFNANAGGYTQLDHNEVVAVSDSGYNMMFSIGSPRYGIIAPNQSGFGVINRDVDWGNEYNYIRFLGDFMVLLGGGMIVDCRGSCSTNIEYYRTLSGVFNSVVSDLPPQRIVSAVVNARYEKPESPLLLLATRDVDSETDFYSTSEDDVDIRGEHLWLVDLNNVDRIKKIQLPESDLAVPRTKFLIEDLIYRDFKEEFLVVGQWEFDSKKENTVLLTIDESVLSLD